MDGLVLFVFLPVDQCYLNTSVKMKFPCYFYPDHAYSCIRKIVLFLRYKNWPTSFQYDIQGWGVGLDGIQFVSRSPTFAID